MDGVVAARTVSTVDNRVSVFVSFCAGGTISPRSAGLANARTLNALKGSGSHHFVAWRTSATLSSLITMFTFRTYFGRLASYAVGGAC